MNIMQTTFELSVSMVIICGKGACDNARKYNASYSAAPIYHHHHHHHRTACVLEHLLSFVKSYHLIVSHHVPLQTPREDRR